MDGSTLPKMDDFDKTEGAILALYREVGGKCTLRNKIVCKIFTKTLLQSSEGTFGLP